MSLPYSRAVGLFVLIAGVVATIVLIGAGVTQGWIIPKITIFGVFGEATYVKSNDPITLSGFQVGEVGKLSLTEDLRVVAELKIQRRYMPHLSKNTIARPQPPLILGPGEIQLTTDPSGPRLSPGDTIITRAAGGPMVLLDELPAVLEKADLLIHNLEEVSKNAASMSEFLAHPDSSLMRMIRASADLTEALSYGDGLIPALIQESAFKIRVDSTMAAATETSRELQRLMERLGPLLDSTDSLLTEAGALTGQFGEVTPELTAELIPALRELRLTLEKTRSSWLLGGTGTDAEVDDTPGMWRMSP